MASAWQAVCKQTTNPPRQAIGKDRQMVTIGHHCLFGSSQNESKTFGGETRKAVSTGGDASTSDMCILRASCNIECDDISYRVITCSCLSSHLLGHMAK